MPVHLLTICPSSTHPRNRHRPRRHRVCIANDDLPRTQEHRWPGAEKWAGARRGGGSALPLRSTEAKQGWEGQRPEGRASWADALLQQKCCRPLHGGGHAPPTAAATPGPGELRAGHGQQCSLVTAPGVQPPVRTGSSEDSPGPAADPRRSAAASGTRLVIGGPLFPTRELLLHCVRLGFAFFSLGRDPDPAPGLLGGKPGDRQGRRTLHTRSTPWPSQGPTAKETTRLPGQPGLWKAPGAARAHLLLPTHRWGLRAPRSTEIHPPSQGGQGGRRWSRVTGSPSASVSGGCQLQQITLDSVGDIAHASHLQFWRPESGTAGLFSLEGSRDPFPPLLHPEAPLPWLPAPPIFKPEVAPLPSASVLTSPPPRF